MVMTPKTPAASIYMVYLDLSEGFLRSSEKPPKMKPDFNLILVSLG